MENAYPLTSNCTRLRWGGVRASLWVTGLLISLVTSGCGQSRDAERRSAELTALILSPSTPVIEVGKQVQMVVTGVYDSGRAEVIEDYLEWDIGDRSIATIDPRGRVTGVSPGTTMVVLTELNTQLSAEMVITVGGGLDDSLAAVQSIALESSELNLLLGQQHQLVVLGYYSDGSEREISEGLVWSSSDAAVAAVAVDGVATGVGVGVATISVTREDLGLSAETLVTVASPSGEVTLVALEVFPVTLDLEAGQSHQLIVTGIYSDGSTTVLNGEAAWSSSHREVADVNALGLLRALAAGEVTVTVQVGDLLAQVSVSVTGNVQPDDLVSMVLSPADFTLFAGGTVQFQAMGEFGDGSQRDITERVAWQSSNLTVVAPGQSGLLFALTPGEVVIFATDPLTGVTSSTALTVSASPGSSEGASHSPLALVAPVTHRGYVLRGEASYYAVAVDPAVRYVVSVTDIAADIDLWVHGDDASFSSAQQTCLSLSSGTSDELCTFQSATGGVLYIRVTGLLASTDNAYTLSVRPQTIEALGDIPIQGLGAVVKKGWALYSARVSAGSVYDVSLTHINGDVDLRVYGDDASFSEAVCSSEADGEVDEECGGIAVVGTTLYFAADGSESWLPATFEIRVVERGSESVLSSLTLSPEGVVLDPGATQQLTVTGTFGDGSTAAIGAGLTWTSANESICRVDSTGLLLGLSQGVCLVTVRHDATGLMTAVTASITGDVTFIGAPGESGTLVLNTQVIAGDARVYSFAIAPKEFYSVELQNLTGDVDLRVFDGDAALEEGVCTSNRASTVGEECSFLQADGERVYFRVERVAASSLGATFSVVVQTYPTQVLETTSESGLSSQDDTRVYALPAEPGTVYDVTWTTDASGGNLLVPQRPRYSTEHVLDPHCRLRSEGAGSMTCHNQVATSDLIYVAVGGGAESAQFEVSVSPSSLSTEDVSVEGTPPITYFAAGSSLDNTGYGNYLFDVTPGETYVIELLGMTDDVDLQRVYDQDDRYLTGCEGSGDDTGNFGTAPERCVVEAGDSTQLKVRTWVWRNDAAFVVRVDVAE